ncbi:hypothetical protein Ddc_02847 [Ditylenchus destructor]|nr:hypothetical protein Ddc_02847 [Ditylenchus destructor]
MIGKSWEAVMWKSLDRFVYSFAINMEEILMPAPMNDTALNDQLDQNEDRHSQDIYCDDNTAIDMSRTLMELETRFEAKLQKEVRSLNQQFSDKLGRMEQKFVTLFQDFNRNNLVIQQMSDKLNEQTDHVKEVFREISLMRSAVENSMSRPSSANGFHRITPENEACGRSVIDFLLPDGDPRLDIGASKFGGCSRRTNAYAADNTGSRYSSADARNYRNRPTNYAPRSDYDSRNPRPYQNYRGGYDNGPNWERMSNNGYRGSVDYLGDGRRGNRYGGNNYRNDNSSRVLWGSEENVTPRSPFRDGHTFGTKQNEDRRGKTPRASNFTIDDGYYRDYKDGNVDAPIGGVLYDDPDIHTNETKSSNDVTNNSNYFTGRFGDGIADGGLLEHFGSAEHRNQLGGENNEVVIESATDLVKNSCNGSVENTELTSSNSGLIGGFGRFRRGALKASTDNKNCGNVAVNLGTKKEDHSGEAVTQAIHVPKPQVVGVGGFGRPGCRGRLNFDDRVRKTSLQLGKNNGTKSENQPEKNNKSAKSDDIPEKTPNSDELSSENDISHHFNGENNGNNVHCNPNLETLYNDEKCDGNNIELKDDANGENAQNGGTAKIAVMM